MRKEVNSNHHGSNLRKASPQATINEDASANRLFARTRSDNTILANGLAINVLTCVRVATTSSIPGITAQPPASTMWSTWLYWVEVKKNCSARDTSSARFSMNGFSN